MPKNQDDIDFERFERRAAVLDMAYEIIAMNDEIEYLRARVAELKEYRDKYNEEVRNSIAHSQKMMGGLLQLAITPGVPEALAKHARAG